MAVLARSAKTLDPLAADIKQKGGNVEVRARAVVASVAVVACLGLAAPLREPMLALS